MADLPEDGSSPSLPLTVGASGPAVADLQRRLIDLGFTPDVDGIFAQRTTSAVEAFQSLRGLVATGSCDGATWAAIVEAGFDLGDRVLYLTRPMLRGDDIADLQRQLGGLGFDAGRIDGILGPDTDGALREFQRHSGLRPDGVCGPATLAQLARLGPRITSPASVAGVRERERLRNAPRHLHERRILVAHAGGLDAIAHALTRALSATGAQASVVQHRDPSTVAGEANTLEAEVVIDLDVGPGPCWCAFYRSDDFESSGGRRLAEVLTAELSAAGFEVTEPRGMRLPTLRETRMPAVVMHLGPATSIVTGAGALTSACASGVERWIREPLSPQD